MGGGGQHLRYLREMQGIIKRETLTSDVVASQQVYLQVGALSVAAGSIGPPPREVLIVLRFWTPALWTEPFSVVTGIHISGIRNKQELNEDFSWTHVQRLLRLPGGLCGGPSHGGDLPRGGDPSAGMRH